MSAIAGIFYKDGRRPLRQQLEQMLEKMAHRGLDGVGVWQDGSIALGQRMLHTTPESLHETLPLDADSLAITGDARLDNREDLLSQLGINLHPNDIIPDSQLILAAYRHWGETCAEKLIGAFVFAIWDKKRQRLFCARDHIGFKSYYYYDSKTLFAFASEIKALLCLEEIPNRINELKIAYYLTDVFEDTKSTFYEGICSLRPAHTVIVEADKFESSRYWTLDAQKEIRMKNPDEYAMAFRELFTKVTGDCLRSAFPVGSFLSGGLDSSSVAMTARQVLAASKPLHTFSGVFPNLPPEFLHRSDERDFVERITQKPGIIAHFIEADKLDPLAEVDRMLWLEDEPFLGFNAYLHWAIYAEAQSNGVRIVLDGIDGDTVVSHGWEYLAELAAHGRWLKLIQEVNAYKKNTGLRFSRRRMIWRQGFKPLLPKLNPDSRPVWQDSVISRDFARHMRLDERVRALGPKYQPKTAREKHKAGMQSHLYTQVFAWVDKMSSAFPLEARYPFFDRRLMTFCLALPASQKFNQGWPRIILRRAMESILPAEIQWRWSKSDLSPNFNLRFLDHELDGLASIIGNSGSLAPYIDRLIATEYHNLCRLNQHRQSHIMSLYHILILDRWLKNYAQMSTL